LAFGMLLATSLETLAWECVAASEYSYGVGWSDTQRRAAKIALRECAIRTAPGDMCYLQDCTPYRAEAGDSSGGDGFPEGYGSDYKLKLTSEASDMAAGTMKPKE